MMKRFYLAAILPLFMVTYTYGQTLPVGNQLEDYYRTYQLLGKVGSNMSFTVRPVTPSYLGIKNVFYPQDENYTDPKFSKLDNGSKFNYQLLPVSIQTQTNTDHPYGWNDGAMIPARGFQTLVSAGFYASYGHLSIQLRPELVMAQNSNFSDFNLNIYPIIAAWYYDFYNNIDLPARFGTGSYNKFYWGQSSVRFNYGAFSFGLSTENLWWGPGIRNSLLMSNDAPGFPHLTLNTLKPVKTPIGSFEGQLIAGRLENSGYPPLTPGWDLFSTDLYNPKPATWRYLSGLVLSWQPKWVPGLFLGTTRSAQLYHTDLSGIGDYLPFFSPIKAVEGDQTVGNKKDTRSSIFARWVWQQEHAEFYFEYGYNNSNNNLRNTALDPSDSRAYIVGLRKIFILNEARDQNIAVNLEVTQLAETSPDKIADAQSWYVNDYVRQGYTNEGQSLGAGIGPGGNLQSVSVNWFSGLKKIGLQIERYVHNDDYYYYVFTRSSDWRRHWVDLSVTPNLQWDYNHLIFNAGLGFIHSQDYQWYLDPSLEKVGQSYFINGKTAFNLQIQAGVTYRFN